uniref:Uncharacterized protein n=1 Tax=Mycena chlorophos TaxID=658473 RepID=A0ABQ0MDG0_MYCCL|nr:predicted protein [Mycena chlorophos]
MPLTPSENHAIAKLAVSASTDFVDVAALVLSDERQQNLREIHALSTKITHAIPSASSSFKTITPAASHTSLAPPSSPTRPFPHRGTYHVVRELGPDTPDEAILRVFRRKSYQAPSTQFEHDGDSTPLW